MQPLFFAAQLRLLQPPQNVLAKGTNNSVPHNGSHPDIGTIWDAGQTDLKRKLPTLCGRSGKGNDTCKWDEKEKLLICHHYPYPNPIKAIIKRDFHSPDSSNQK